MEKQPTASSADKETIEQDSNWPETVEAIDISQFADVEVGNGCPPGQRQRRLY